MINVYNIQINQNNTLYFHNHNTDDTHNDDNKASFEEHVKKEKQKIENNQKV